ncbi:MAG: ketopantoate reductase family protein, partial [Blastocatellia bacterium]
CVLPLQNGVESAEQLSAILGQEHVLGGLCKLVSFVVEPGFIKHTGFDPMVAFNELNNRVSARVERLSDSFSKAGVIVQVPGDIQSAIWNKFLFIAPFSGVGAVTRAPAGVLIAFPETRAMLDGAMTEIVNIARASQVGLAGDSVQKAVASLQALPENATASMQRDIIAGRPSELDSQNGAVVRIGRRLGVPTPVNEMIYYSLLPQELRARGTISFS